jgi:hypothetical protein
LLLYVAVVDAPDVELDNAVVVPVVPSAMNVAVAVDAAEAVAVELDEPAAKRTE